MKKAAASTTTKSPSGKEDHFSLGTLAIDLLDTAWRIAVPVVIFAGGGIFADLKLHTKPWTTLIGTGIGLVVAGLLVKQQLAGVSPEDKI